MSTKGRYGLRLMIELASRWGEGPVLAHRIEKSQQISGKYLHVLVGKLKSAGLVKAVRGPHGGYELTRPPSSITVLDIVSALEGRSAPVECVRDASVCSRTDCCPAQGVWRAVADAVDDTLAKINLDELASPAGETKLGLYA